jgi:malonyl-CoA O-methyltransferase
MPTRSPRSILDLGCGTGFAAEAAALRWPDAAVTALDPSINMLDQARRKVERLRTIAADAAEVMLNERFDLIVSSMMLHWLPSPEAMLDRWCGWLNLGGLLCVAFPVAGSFQEWRDLCATHDVSPGLWPLPQEDLVQHLTAQRETQDIAVSYASAHDFVRQLKVLGAATSTPGHKPAAAAAMRRLLEKAPQPFTVTYRVTSMAISPQINI